ncbi:hypothetical protein BXZ70DRAFT_620071 [Cristinia sonorae]|uniref:Uncharacterized protein n=1 Tax=Cristinia sonorae TaxID=1940300 RepID=A0A8K0UWY2_9AGAR|nr:hypothetical protein BXZ70DRAFT_620071 [Cristinia sonorae]
MQALVGKTDTYSFTYSYNEHNRELNWFISPPLAAALQQRNIDLIHLLDSMRQVYCYHSAQLPADVVRRMLSGTNKAGDSVVKTIEDLATQVYQSLGDIRHQQLENLLKEYALLKTTACQWQSNSHGAFHGYGHMDMTSINPHDTGTESEVLMMNSDMSPDAFDAFCRDAGLNSELASQILEDEHARRFEAYARGLLSFEQLYGMSL